MDKHRADMHGQRLLQAGISRKVVKRYLKEIDAHYQDLLAQARFQGLPESEAIAWATQRLGSEEQLLESMKSRPELRSWTYRHPWMSMLLLPAILYIVSVVLVFLPALTLVVLLAPADNTAFAMSSLPPWLDAVVASSIWFVTYGLTPALVVAVIVWANRHYLLPMHQIAGVVLICVLGSGMSLKLEWPDPAQQRQGVAAIGFGYAWNEHRSWESAFHAGKKLRLAGNLILCGGLFCMLRRRQHSLAG